MRIFIVNGLPQAGKTTFERACTRYYDGEVKIISTVDFVKYVAAICGWDGTKTPKNRKFLSDLKAMLAEWNDVPWKKIATELQSIAREERDGLHKYETIVFIDSREPAEIARFSSELCAQSILVTRPELSAEAQSNTSDANVFDYDYDYVISNDGTVDEWEEKAKLFLKTIF